MPRAPLFRTPSTRSTGPATYAVIVFAALALPVFAMSGCTVSTVRTAGRPSPSSTSAAPPSPTPSPLAPTTSAPTATPTTPPPPPPPPVPVIPANLPVTTGKGPAGSMKTTGGPNVALTFDDGPDSTYTPQLLNLLKANGVKATFCLVGKQVKANPGLVRRIVAEGHTVCAHTWSHSLELGKQPKEVILTDLRDTNAAIRAAAPGVKIQYFRAPGGNFTPLLVETASELGMRSLYWALDTRDWEYSTWGHGQTMVDHIIETVQTKVRRGCIILSHDFKKPDTITAYKTLLPWLKSSVTLIAMPVT